MAAEAINLSHTAAEDMVASQLAQGLKKDGTMSNFVYSPFTVEAKKEMSGLAAITSHLTNYDTGESYRKLYMKVSGEKVIFGTRTDKEADISKRMNSKAFGLAPENKEEFIRQHAQGQFNRLVRELIKL